MNKKENKDYKLISITHDGETIEYQVVNTHDNFAWGKGHSIKGAIIGAMIAGIRLKDMDFNNHWVPVQECLKVVMS